MNISNDESQKSVVVAHGVSKIVDTGDVALTILHAVDLEIKKGESVAILGRSGSGKTTLLGLLAGMDLPTHGSVSLAGYALQACDEDQRADLRARYTGFVFQSFQLIPNMTALENVMLPLELSGDKDAKHKAETYLTQVGLKGRMKHFPYQLSGGEQQRVSIARAFACEPIVLFADEPTGSLDGETGAEISDLLFHLNTQAGTTLVLVTHDEKLAQRCERQIVLDDGKIVKRC